MIQVFELQETSQPAIIMAYHPHGNMVDADIVDEDKYITAFGQVLDGLCHLHKKGLAHRDLKPENFLVETKPLFKVIIADFGMANIASDVALLQTFCGSLRYAAPEVFPSFSSGHGPLVDIWSLGVIILEWMYGVPNIPDAPKPNKKCAEVPAREWCDWLSLWTRRLLNRLKDQEDDKLTPILLHMIKVKVEKRWPALWCLTQGFRNALFKRRTADGLVACMRDSDNIELPAEEDETKTPAVESSLCSDSSQVIAPISPADLDPETTIILGNLWNEGGSGESVPWKSGKSKGYSEASCARREKIVTKALG